MKNILLSILLTATLFAQDKHPSVYESLGNEIYDNVFKIEKLKDVVKYVDFESKIDTYVAAVAQTKELGFDIEAGKKSDLKLEYLHQIREHKKSNDYFIRSVNNSFKSALDTQDNDLFLSIVNCGLLDIKVNKKKIISYYNLHASEIDTTGVIQDLLDEDVKAKKNSWKPKTKAELQAEKVKRLRENDRLEQEALENKLSEEMRLKKEKIRKEQEKELFN